MQKPTPQEQRIRQEIATMFLTEYLPEIKEEVLRFNNESYGKKRVAEEVAKICNTKVFVEAGELKLAKPTNKFIDRLVKYVGVQTEK